MGRRLLRSVAELILGVGLVMAPVSAGGQTAGPLTAQPWPAAAVGQTVRISLTTGEKRKATFLGLTATELRVRERGGDTTYLLDHVLKVETVHHTAASAATYAAIPTFVVTLLLSCGQGDEEDCWPEYAALMAGAAAGVGAIIGGAISRANAAKHVVYAAPKRTVSIMPMVTPHRAGFGVAVRW